MSQSNLFYFNINNHDIEILISKIQSGSADYTLDKMIENGLFADRAQAVRERLNFIDSEELIRIRQEEERLIQERNNVNRKQQIIDFCNQIADNQKNLEEIKISIINNLVSLEEIEQNLHESRLSPEICNKIRYYITGKRQIDFYLWKDLPPLLNDRTDIYFFGQPASGKSCILANFFSYINKYGLFIENAHSIIGVNYKNLIQSEYDLGYLPERTGEGVNYITFDLIDPNNSNDKYPLNFIEMSGELFDQATTNKISENNLNAKNYLNNDNRKLLFFVIDYDRHVQSIMTPDGSTPQGNKMVAILSLLDEFGAFEKTDGIYILVSKADLFPPGIDPTKFASDWLNENYLAFINNCKHLKEKYKKEISITAYPYSIGNLTLKSSYVYERDYKWASKMVEEIVSKAFFNKSKGGWFGFFK